MGDSQSPTGEGLFHAPTAAPNHSLMTATDQPAELYTDPGWFPDPLRQHHLRYFDGDQWTDHVTHRGPEPCGRCHTGIEVDGGGSMQRTPHEVNRATIRRGSPGDLTGPRRKPDRRRVRGREDASRR